MKNQFILDRIFDKVFSLIEENDLIELQNWIELQKPDTPPFFYVIVVNDNNMIVKQTQLPIKIVCLYAALKHGALHAEYIQYPYIRKLTKLPVFSDQNVLEDMDSIPMLEYIFKANAGKMIGSVHSLYVSVESFEHAYKMYERWTR